MIEVFKLTAEKIKRVLKLAVHLPTEYYGTNKKYPLLIVLDGGLFFSFLNEDNKVIDLKTILDNYDKDIITIGLFKPRLEEWNISELNPYYSQDNEKVDTSYSYVYYDYIVNDLIPLLNQKYRFSNDISVMGMGLGAISVIPLLSKYDVFKKGLIYSLDFDEVNDLIFDDSINIKEKEIYLYQGEKDISIESIDKFSKLERILTDNLDDKFIVDYDKDNGNEIENIKEHIEKGLEII